MPAARVLIDGPSELVFDYAIPDGLPVVPGCRVRVPLRNKLSNGTVLDLVPTENLGFALRPRHSLSDPEPLITAKPRARTSPFASGLKSSGACA